MAADLRATAQTFFAAVLIIGSLSAGLPVPQNAAMEMPATVEATPIQQPNEDMMSQVLQPQKIDDSPTGEMVPPLVETPAGEMTLLGTPMGETPMGGTPMVGTPMVGTAVGETPMGGTPMGETPMVGTPMAGTPMGETPMGETPMGGTPMVGTPMGGTPMAGTAVGETSIPTDVQQQLQGPQQPAAPVLSRPDCPEMGEKHTIVCEDDDKKGDVFQLMPDKDLPPASPVVDSTQ